MSRNIVVLRELVLHFLHYSRRERTLFIRFASKFRESQKIRRFVSKLAKFDQLHLTSFQLQKIIADQKVNYKLIHRIKSLLYDFETSEFRLTNIKESSREFHKYLSLQQRIQVCRILITNHSFRLAKMELELTFRQALKHNYLQIQHSCIELALSPATHGLFHHERQKWKTRLEKVQLDSTQLMAAWHQLYETLDSLNTVCSPCPSQIWSSVIPALQEETFKISFKANLIHSLCEALNLLQKHRIIDALELAESLPIESLNIPAEFQLAATCQQLVLLQANWHLKHFIWIEDEFSRIMDHPQEWHLKVELLRFFLAYFVQTNQLKLAQELIFQAERWKEDRNSLADILSIYSIILAFKNNQFKKVKLAYVSLTSRELKIRGGMFLIKILDILATKRLGDESEAIDQLSLLQKYLSRHPEIWVPNGLDPILIIRNYLNNSPLEFSNYDFTTTHCVYDILTPLLASLCIKTPE